MPLREHPRFAEFAKWFARKKRLGKPLIGTFFRVAGPRFTTAKAILSGIGASIGGGRWNPPMNGMNVVYLSREPETALMEANEHFRYHRIPVSEGMPKVIVAVRVKLERVFEWADLTPNMKLPVSRNEILEEDWRAIMSQGREGTAQAIGRAAFSSGFQGLLVPARPDAPNGVNLLVFPSLLSKRSTLKVLNADELDNLGKTR